MLTNTHFNLVEASFATLFHFLSSLGILYLRLSSSFQGRQNYVKTSFLLKRLMGAELEGDVQVA